MTLAEQNLQDALVKQYFSNMHFLQETDFDLYTKIDTLSSLINSGIYKEKFILEFLSDSGDFDILNIENNHYLYNKNAKQVNDEFVNSVDFSIKNTFSNLNHYLYMSTNKDIEINDSKFKILDKIFFNDMSEYYGVLGNTSSNKEYKEIDKFLFLGSLLGKHFDLIQKKINFKSCFIYEENLEIFRLSLFVSDYATLSLSSNIIFSIMDDNNNYSNKINIFLNKTYPYSNYNIKYLKMNYIDDNIYQGVLTQLHLSNSSNYDYTKILYDTFYSISKHINKYNILTTKNKIDSFSLSNNLPVLFVAAGPSLNENIDWIRNNKNSFIIVAIGATYKKLFENGIEPDILTTVDPKFDILDKSHFNLNDVKLLRNTIVIASINTPTKILNRFNQDKLFLYEVFENFKNNSIAYSGVSIGEISLSILLDLNVKEIYLIGTDLSLNKKTGNSHFDGYINATDNGKLDEKQKIDSSLKTGISTIRNEFLLVKGNDNEQVVTNRMFALSINQYNYLIDIFRKDNQTIYNLCKNGAFIEGTIFKEIDSINFNKNIESKSFLMQNLEILSEFGLNKEELILLERKINTISLLKKEMVQIFNNENSSTNIIDFKKKLDKLILKIISTEETILINIISNYLKLVLPYIYYSLNNKIDDNKEIQIVNIEHILFKQTENILSVYESYLRYIKKPSF
jgi:hypothetical protein